MTSAATFLLLVSTLVGPAQPATTREPDELLLQRVGVEPEADALSRFARLRVESPSPAAIRAAIQAVASGTDKERSDASVLLLAAGPAALPYLQRGAREFEDGGGEPFAALVTALEGKGSPTTTAAVRLLVKKAPDRAAAALLTLIPTAEDELVLGEVRTGLAALARRQPAAASALRKALEDPLALRRAVAIEAVALGLPAEAMTTLKPFLDDRVAFVQFRAALALGATHEEAVVRLIGLLADLPAEAAQEAEEFLLGLAQDQAPRVSLTNRAEARDAWRKWWDATTGDALLTELRKRTLFEEDRVKVQKLIAQLGAEDFDAREKASADLKTLGPRVRSMLREALRGDDAEVVQRARGLLDGMAKDNVIPLPVGVPRLLALRRPAGAVEALLAYLPFNEDAGLVEDVVAALDQIAQVQPTARKLLIAALDDAVPVRRQVALEALGRVADLAALDPIKRCLDDRDGGVRLRAALALVRLGERAGVSAVLEQVAQVSGTDDERLLDDFLHRLCDGLDRPAVTEGGAEDARRKRQAEWQKWWRDNDARVALPRYDDEQAREVLRHSGLTLVVLNGTGTVVAYDPDFAIRWQLRGLTTPFDAQALPGDRVLVTEHDLRRVTERNLQGDVLWEKKVAGNPVQAERLPSGNTLIVCRDRVVEVTRTGREVFTIHRPNGDLYTARKLRDGSVACVSNQGRCFRLDARGAEVSGFRLPNGAAHLANDLLPGGGALIPIAWQNKITEYDRDGKVVKDHAFPTPVSAQRLSTGGLLLVNQQFPPRLVELDRAGQVVRETTLATNPIRAVRR